MLKKRIENKKLKILILGANSEIGNQIIKEAKFGEQTKRVFVGRTFPGSEFRYNDIFHKFEASEYLEFKSQFRNILEKNRINLVIISYASNQYSDEYFEARSNIVNFNSITSFASTTIEYFEQENFGTLIYVSSSIIKLRPREKNYKYTSAKLAADYYVNGLRNSLKNKNVKIVIIRPGYTKTKIHEGEIPGPFSTTKEKLAKSISKQLRLRFKIIYAPFLIRIPISFLRLVPSKLLDVLDVINSKRF